ncbi:hypothetical protein [Dactylosporangium sp. NPDC051541]|uniref:hypothetical protein n=1 Tax=Dactylosporangium sp. NPDC051541 TaxID=3363977 RepID=UPI00378ACB88
MTGAARTITFDNGTGGRCLATLVVPAEPGDAAVIISHGGTADGRRFFLDEARDLARQGVTVLLPATEDYLRRLRRFEPVGYVAVPGRRRLLFQYGVRDDAVLRSEAVALYEAAAAPKEWCEYDCGHDTDNAAARADRARLFTGRSP